MDKTTVQQYKVQQFETDPRQGIQLIKFSVKKLKFSCQQDLVDETTAQPKVQQFESTGFQDPQAAAETSGY